MKILNLQKGADEIGGIRHSLRPGPRSTGATRFTLHFQSAPRCGPSAPPSHEVRFDNDFFGVGQLYRSVDALQYGLSSKDAHLAERWLDGRKAGVLKRGALNIIEADH